MNRRRAIHEEQDSKNCSSQPLLQFLCQVSILAPKGKPANPLLFQVAFGHAFNPVAETKLGQCVRVANDGNAKNKTIYHENIYSNLTEILH